MSILFKLLLNGVIAVPGLVWSGTSLPFALLASAAFVLFSYVVGDLVILPRSNNTFASTADFALSFAFFWVAVTLFQQPFRLPGLFVTSFFLSVAEYFFHDYLQRRGPHHSKHPG